jgi:colanic acid biosynthesis glycosyl transferase WcaI
MRGAAFVYNVQELYPDIAVKMRQLCNPFVISALRVLERFVYRHASMVTVISAGMRRAVVACGVPESRVLLIPNFVDMDLMRPGSRHNAFSQEHGLDARFVVSYAGNMGFAQGLDMLLGAAELLVRQADILFLFVGDGVLREWLVEQARAKSLGNTRFVAHQPYARVPEIYAASDVCVVAMISTIASEGVPSKFMRIMACGRPVLAMVDGASDLASEVAASAGGVVVPTSSAEAIAQAVLAFHDAPERCHAAGAAGRAYASRHYARGVVTGRYAELFRTIATRGAGA